MKKEEILIVNVVLSSYKTKLRFTIPSQLIKSVNAKIGDYIKINLRKDIYSITYYSRIPNIPKSRTNLQVRKAVPKEFIKKAGLNKNDVVDLSISLVKDIRSSNLIKGCNLDIITAIPEKTKTGKPIMIDLFSKNNEEWIKVWYCSAHGGKVKEIELRRFVKINKKIGEFFGLMQAEGGKKDKFTFTNKFLSEHKLFIEVAELFGISKDLWSYILYHKPNLDMKTIESGLVNFSKSLNINKRISVIKNKDLKKFVYAIYVSGNLFEIVMLNILIKLRTLLSNTLIDKISLQLKEFAKGFILKDLLGDGTVIVRSNKSGVNIIISEQDLEAQKDIINIFKIFNIKAKARGIEIYISTNFESYLWLLKNEAFLEHSINRKKLISCADNNYYFNCLYERLTKLNRCSIQKFSEIYNLPYKTAEMYLYRNFLRNYFSREQKKRMSIYKITEKGKEFVDIIKNAKSELINLLQQQEERT